MPALTVNGITVPIRPTQVDALDLTYGERAFDGTWDQAPSGTATSVRALPCEVVRSRMAAADYTSLRDALLAPGTVDAGGDLLAPGGGTVACRAVEVSDAVRMRGSTADPIVGDLRFRLEEVDANA